MLSGVSGRVTALGRAVVLAVGGQELSVRSGVERRVRNRAPGGHSSALIWAECSDPGRGRAGIQKRDQGFVASGNMQVQEGDKVVVFTVPSGMKKLEKFFK